MRKLLPIIALIVPLTSQFVVAAELLPPDRPLQEVIDHYIDLRLQQQNVKPAVQATDANLLRRTMLDLVGRIPTVVEARQYINSEDASKRMALVDKLMNSSSFARHQANEFDAMLMYGSGKNMRDYLQRSFESKRSWDQMFRDMLIGDEKDENQKGATEFVKARVGDIDKLANEASSKFFGINVSCAKCHDHPEVSEWTQAHFFGMKSFFSRTFDNGGFVGERGYGIVKYKTTAGEEHEAKLMYLTGTVIDEPEAKEPSDDEKKKEKKRLEELKKKKQAPPAPKFSRREKLVEIALQENEYFAKSIVNKLWYRFFGLGMVMPVDQMHPENPASHPELMDWLTRDLIAHKYDLRRLIRGIVLSQTYSRSSRWQSGSMPAMSLFAVANVRPLSPHQYGTTLKLASTSPDQFTGAMKPEDFEKRIEGIENGGRGLAGLFEQPTEDFQISVSEALLFSNNDRIKRDLLRDSGDALIGKMKQIESLREALEIAVWTVFSRPPEVDELDALEEYVKAREDRKDEAFRQIVWALLTSSESRFNY
jgi:hypothetical protein